MITFRTFTTKGFMQQIKIYGRKNQEKEDE